MADMLQLWREMDRAEKIGGLICTVAGVAFPFFLALLFRSFGLS